MLQISLAALRNEGRGRGWRAILPPESGHSPPECGRARPYPCRLLATPITSPHLGRPIMPSPVQALKKLTVALAICLSWPAASALAQCPDGSPPPCRGARAAPPPPSHSVAVLHL